MDDQAKLDLALYGKPKPREKPFFPTIKITIENNRNRTIKRFEHKFDMRTHTEKPVQANARKDMLEKLEGIINEIFAGWV